jgi:hypothetical protein
MRPFSSQASKQQECWQLLFHLMEQTEIITDQVTWDGPALSATTIN